MDNIIKVDLEDLIDKLTAMKEDGFSAVQLEFNQDEYYDASTLKLKAIDISEEEDVEYGELQSLSELY